MKITKPPNFLSFSSIEVETQVGYVNSHYPAICPVTAPTYPSSPRLTAAISASLKLSVLETAQIATSHSLTKKPDLSRQ